MSSQTMAAPMVGHQGRTSTSEPYLDLEDSTLPYNDPDAVRREDASTLAMLSTMAQGAWVPKSNNLPSTSAVEDSNDKQIAISNLLAQLAHKNTTPQEEASPPFSKNLRRGSEGSGHLESRLQQPAEITFQPTLPQTSAEAMATLPHNRPSVTLRSLITGPDDSPKAMLFPDPDHPTQKTTTAELPSNVFDILSGPSQQGDLPDSLHEAAEKNQIEAFAKLEFADGNYYITTHSCELGRDVRALQAAQRAAESKSSQGERSARRSRPSHRSDPAKREGGSIVKGSVISEKGGFCGMDDTDDVTKEQAMKGQRKEAAKHSHSSAMSESDVVNPEDLLRGPGGRFDYGMAAEMAAPLEEDDEKPAPVTSEHLPPANRNPLIPIHHMTDSEKTEIENHKAVSRRHVRIAWDFQRNCFKLHVLGRNGAFLDNNYIPQNNAGFLHHNSKIQIAGIEVNFKLPNSGIESTSEESEQEMEESPEGNHASTTPTSQGDPRSASPSRGGKTKSGVRIKIVKKAEPAKLPGPLLAPNGQPMPPKKRGPGRPPKDGIMSNRERRELAKAQKAAEAKARNNGVTPPPTGRENAKITLQKQQAEAEETKPEKRKYTKRKREGDDVLPSIEGDDGEMVDGGSDDENQKLKKTRASRSLSPEYPPKESLTVDQLSKPPDNYARLIYDILSDIHPKELGLRQIYRALKKKYPYFVHGVNTEGWQSSVRHNLNSEHTKLFDKGQKDGKGWAWRAIPEALPPKEEIERKRKEQAAAAEQKAKTSQGQPRYQQPPPAGRPGPNSQWQANGGMHPPFPPPPNGAPAGTFYNMPPNGVTWPAPWAPTGPPPSHNVRQPGPNPKPGSVPPGPPNGPQQMTFAFPPPFDAQGRPNPQWVPPPPAPHLQHRQHTNSPRPSGSGPPSDPYLPCTQDGLNAIDRFESGILEGSDNKQERDELQHIFRRVRDKVLNGQANAELPPGQRTDVILGHVEEMVGQHRNPNFKGFGVNHGKAAERKLAEAQGHNLVVANMQMVSGPQAAARAGPANAQGGPVSTQGRSINVAEPVQTGQVEVEQEQGAADETK